MGWFNKLVGSVSGNVAEVNSDNEILVGLPKVISKVGFVKPVTTDGNAFEDAGDGRLDIGQDSPLFEDFIDGAAIDSIKWLQYVATQTIVQSGSYLTLNSGAVTTLNTGAFIQSRQYFQQLAEARLYAKFDFEVNVATIPNNSVEIGFGTLASQTPTAALVDFIGLRMRPNGDTVIAVWFNGIALSEIVVPNLSINTIHAFEMKVQKDMAIFELDGVDLGTIAVPAGSPSLTSAASLPLLIINHTEATAPTNAVVLKIAGVSVMQKIIGSVRSWELFQVMQGRGSYQSPVTPFAQTRNHANSTSPVSATLSNTAAGYTTLGGRFQFAAPAGAATDYALFGYQVPAGKRLLIYSLGISSVNTGAAVATTATILDWSIGLNSSAVSLATADAFATNVMGPRRLPMGIHAYQVGAGIGAQATDTIRMFSGAPLAIDGGQFFHIIVQVPVGTATASQIIRGDIQLNGYFE